MAKLAGKIAVVTGASRGIGRAIALRLAEEGAQVVSTATTLDGANKTVDAIKQNGGSGHAIAVDISDENSVAAMVKNVLEHFNTIDILVNNAGITRDNLLVRMSKDDWQKVMDVNLSGAFYCIKSVTKTMMRKRAGKIINITSIVGQIGNAGQANYSAAKAGLIGMTKSIAKELAGRNIQVNCVAPGYIRTDMTANLPEAATEKLIEAIPAGRMGEPEDIAGLVAFLASRDANYITGQVINTDGGMVM
ncbi:MAG: 3-oxoacyl-[acyl-carrier-protein] reductase [bacterium]